MVWSNSKLKNRETGAGKRLGLLEEADSEQTEAVCPLETVPLADRFFDDVYGTAKSVEHLERHPDFKRWLRKGKISASELARVKKCMSIYQDLQLYDSRSFQRLYNKPTQHTSETCGPVSLTTEYVFNVFGTCLCTIALIAGCGVGDYVAAAFLITNSLQWLMSTSVFGAQTQLWWEGQSFGLKASSCDCLTANLIEVLYCFMTLGFGGLVSIAMRLQNGQGLGERAVGIKLVRESEDKSR